MTEINAELIADLTYPSDLQISPDGKQVAYTLRSMSKKEEHATSSLWIAPVDGSQPSRQFTSGETQDQFPQWSPDGRQLAFLSDRTKRGTSQLYLLPVDGGEARALTSKEHKKGINNFAWSPGGGQIAFTSSDEPTEEEEKREKERDDAKVYNERVPYARLRLLSVATKEVTTLVSGERHIDEIAWNPNGTEIAYLVWKKPELDSWGLETVIERISIAGGEPHEICRMPKAPVNLTWSHDGQTLFFVAPVATTNIQSSKAVYAVPAQGGTPRRIACGETNCAEDLRPLQQGQQVAVKVAEGLDTHIYRLDTNGPMTLLSPATEEGQMKEIIDFQTRVVDGEKTVLVVVRSTGTEPWEVWTGSTTNEKAINTLQCISSHQEKLAGLTFGTSEPFYYTAPDGWKLDGILVRPPNAPQDQALPTIVLVHGGPYWRWSAGFHVNWGRWAQWLALDGYAILMPNPRGGQGHGEQFAAAARADVGGADYGDVMAIVDAAIERGIADPERLGIGGWSQGGFMSAWAITQTDRFKAAIMGAGVSDWGLMVLTSDIPSVEVEFGGTAPWEGLEINRHLKLSPITFAHRAKTPVLILHGEQDERVPLNQAIGFHRAMLAYDVPNEFVIYPREPHGITERTHQIDLLRRVRSWFDKWLRA